MVGAADADRAPVAKSMGPDLHLSDFHRTGPTLRCKVIPPDQKLETGRKQVESKKTYLTVAGLTFARPDRH